MFVLSGEKWILKNEHHQGVYIIKNEKKIITVERDFARRYIEVLKRVEANRTDSAVVKTKLKKYDILLHKNVVTYNGNGCAAKDFLNPSEYYNEFVSMLCDDQMDVVEFLNYQWRNTSNPNQFIESVHLGLEIIQRNFAEHDKNLEPKNFEAFKKVRIKSIENWLNSNREVVIPENSPLVKSQQAQPKIEKTDSGFGYRYDPKKFYEAINAIDQKLEIFENKSDVEAFSNLLTSKSIPKGINKIIIRCQSLLFAYLLKHLKYTRAFGAYNFSRILRLELFASIENPNDCLTEGNLNSNYSRNPKPIGYEEIDLILNQFRDELIKK